jgi:serine/threonine-protein kinase
MKHAVPFRRHHRPGSRSGSGLGLPSDLLQVASRRLGFAAVIYACAFTLAYLSFKISFRLAGEGQMVSYKEGNYLWPAVGILLSVAAFLVSRSRLSAKTKIHLGLVYGVLGSLVISLAEFWGAAEYGFLPRYGVSWACVWILTFPMLIPTTPKRMFFTVLAAALTGPLAMHIVILRGAEMPSLSYRILYFSPNWVCAWIAFVVAKIIYHLGAEVREAREMGSYRLVRRLGEGGMGEVWRAEHHLLARPAAIKFIRPEALGGNLGTLSVVRARFEREAQATASLQSPHTVDLYDFGVTDDGTFYYVMEMLEGTDLGDLVERFGPVPPERAVHLLRQACHSLAEAHAAGLIHRDVKPANMFACRLGLDYDFLKVLDFGLVKARDGKELGDATLTRQDSTTGTPAFMAPELATGERPVDARTDLYALGCVAYWLVTGRFVFEGPTPLAIIMQHVQETPAPPSSRTEVEIPAELDRIVLACLAKNPDDRPASAADLAAELEALAVREAWSGERARRWWETNLPRRPEPEPEPETANPDLADTRV